MAERRDDQADDDLREAHALRKESRDDADASQRAGWANYGTKIGRNLFAVTEREQAREWKRRAKRDRARSGGRR